MAYVEPTVEAFKQRFPVFGALPDATVASALAEADAQVDHSWPENLYTLGKMLYAAHVLTLDGQGTGVEAQLSGFKRLRVGPLELERAAASSADFGTLKSTSYGQRYLALLRQFRAGVVVV